MSSRTPANRPSRSTSYPTNDQIVTSRSRKKTTKLESHLRLNTLKLLSILNSKLKLSGRTLKRTGRRSLGVSCQKNQKAKVSSQRDQSNRRDRTRQISSNRRPKVADYLTAMGKPARVYNNKKVSNQSLHRTVNSLPHKIKRRHQSPEKPDKRAQPSQISRQTLTRWNFKHKMPEIGKATTRITPKFPMPSPQTPNRRRWPRCSQVVCSRASASHLATSTSR